MARRHDVPVRRSFWPLIIVAILLEAAGAACLAVAYINRNYESSDFWDGMIRRSVEASTPGTNATEILEASARGLEDPLPWLIVGVLCALVGALALGLAVRRR